MISIYWVNIHDRTIIECYGDLQWAFYIKVLINPAVKTLYNLIFYEFISIGNYCIMKLNERKENAVKKIVHNTHISSSCLTSSSLMLHPMKDLVQSRFSVNAEWMNIELKGKENNQRVSRLLLTLKFQQYIINVIAMSK